MKRFVAERSRRSVSGGSVLGATAFEAITAVEGLELGTEGRRRLRSLLTDQSLTPEDRRKAVLSAYMRTRSLE